MAFPVRALRARETMHFSKARCARSFDRFSLKRALRARGRGAAPGTAEAGAGAIA